MKITNLGVTSTSLTSGAPVDETVQTAAGLPAASADSGAKGYSPSAELQQLIYLVRQQPDVRDDRVTAAMLKLQQGYYLTPASAESTAAAVLTAVD